MQQGVQLGLQSGKRRGSFSSGLQGGKRQGLLANNGFLSYINPTTLKGSQKPLIYFLADDVADFVGSGVAEMTDIANTGNILISAIGSSFRPSLVSKGVNGRRGYLNFNVNDILYCEDIDMSAYNSVTNIYVFRFKVAGSTTTYVYNINDGYPLLSSGDFCFQGTSNLFNGQSRLVGVYDTPSSQYTQGVYNTFSNPFQQWGMITVKHNLLKPTGQGSETKMYVNGVIQQQLIQSDFETPDPPNFLPLKDYHVGNSDKTSLVNGYVDIASGLTLPYWASDGLQRKLENYFRWYFGINF
jgi:hypothetical protein